MISKVEFRAVAAVGLVYTTRMLGLFMILPVLALNGDQYQGATTTSIGLALGIYGLMQAFLQVPFGRVSDRIGRKPIILMGLALFAAGSLLAALAESIEMLIFARAVQGAGAVSGASLALLSECSREQNRSKLMAILGVSIGLSFGLAMVLGPLLAANWGIQSIFWLCIILAAFGSLAILLLTPKSNKAQSNKAESNHKKDHGDLGISQQNNLELWRLNLGIFTLHAAQMSLWVAVPVLLLNNFGVAEAAHWKWYLLAVGGGFLLMAPLMQALAKRNKYRMTLVIGIASLILAQLVLSQASVFVIFVLGLLIFFWGFNLLEATLPSLVSRWVDEENRGAAMGWYASCQFFGTFVGGAIGGMLVASYGLASIFYFGSGLFIFWFVVAAFMQPLPNVKSFVLQGMSLGKRKQLVQERGIISVLEFQEQEEIFVRINMDLVDSTTLEKYAIR